MTPVLAASPSSLLKARGISLFKESESREGEAEEDLIPLD